MKEAQIHRCLWPEEGLSMQSKLMVDWTAVCTGEMRRHLRSLCAEELLGPLDSFGKFQKPVPVKKLFRRNRQKILRGFV